MLTNIFDVIIIGAGSIGVSAAFSLSKEGLSVLVVEKAPSIGQGSNKSAIGGIRATHSHPAKFHLCRDSINMLSSWESNYGDDIEWVQGGYSFVAYTKEIMTELQEIVTEQKALNANIHWLNADQLLERIPSITPDGLLGGTFSPEDGSASPLKTISAFYRQASYYGAQFHFNEKLTSAKNDSNNSITIKTSKGSYHCKHLINCAGAWVNDTYTDSEFKLPVYPNSHEAGVTEPLDHFLDPMVVDMRSSQGISNIYFYQHKTGQLIFCSTPSPPVWGYATAETSSFLPKASKRILELVPRLANCRVRRTWRGLYPMTPDASPLIGFDRHIPGAIIASGMCGQGFMLGPGVSNLLTRMITKQLTSQDKDILRRLSPYRQFDNMESLE
ncbi:MAG: FAD-binding oxidoreductase [Anaerolineaceae bacterium]|nr:FAD-binding oxidoreductase [Anaerolineaceae bacterium]